MTEAVIVATARTPIGRAFRGSLVDVRPDDLLGFIIESLLASTPDLDAASIDDVIVGAANNAGEQGMNLARSAVALSGLPETVPGTTVNRFCASSLQALRMAFHAIKADEGDVYVVGGVESISRTAGRGFQKEDKNDRFVVGQPDFINDMYIPMGQTAENVAAAFDVSRQAMDELAKLSQDRAISAQKNGFFDREITPVPLPDGTTMIRDDGPRADTTLDQLGSLPAAFIDDGTVTAGNSCSLNDGAAAILVMSDRRAEQLGLRPLARIIASSVSALAPEMMGVAPIEAVNKVLAQSDLSIGDIDTVELNEAFAAQVIPVCDELGISITEQLNPHGGAIALGHPFGMTGARIMTTLINDLQTLDQEIGLEALCVGGGQGMAMLIERLS